MNDDRLLAALRSHPWVESAEPADSGVLAVRPAAAAVAVRPAPGPLLQDHLDSWAEVYTFVYSAARDRHAADLDLSGWRASDTGEPFPREHMLEWIGHAVDLVLRGDPRTVLELGCGSGLLAHRLAPKVETYVGTDVADHAVERLRGELPGARIVVAAAHQAAAPHVMRALTPPGAAEPVRPDRIVLNSVTECFPNAAYLSAVVEDALALVAPGGTVVVGDVRNLATLGAFARWVESARDPSLRPDNLDRRAARRAAAEEELVCDPQLFARIGARFAARHGRPMRVVAHAKPFRHDTELTRYRYDVTLTVDPPPAPEADPVTWSALPGSDRVAACAEVLARSGSAYVTGIPNTLLDPADPRAVTPGELAAALPPGVSLLLDSADGRRLAAGRPETVPQPQLADADGELANDPFGRFVDRRLPEELTDHLERLLPDLPVPPLVVDGAAATTPEGPSR
ncbi:class I SAM-dependent methyltransferase [Pseudonocardia sichuanensis]|uniref:Methyltransferase family protein n=1 Tax=Pseudonocardia kunmingensis TaxID=630975 RepID=A0A543D9U3_9PSEU|nr:class I SAM-dependent methyltransferase [Pseudonocardia kunmingensis]TQM06114.1 methyltransferase family protein [Pseudonocardia kunmingensis]